jgi:hypothetical protein
VHVPADQYEMKGAKTQKMLKNLKANFARRDDLYFLKHIVQGRAFAMHWIGPFVQMCWFIVLF